MVKRGGEWRIAAMRLIRIRFDTTRPEALPSFPKRGQPVALMGSTGRSTGPHVHFEVVRNGRPVDPLTFIGR